MSFDVATLLESTGIPVKLSPKCHWDDVASEIVVSGIPPAIELMDFHLDLKRAFQRNTKGITVDLAEAAFLKAEPTQECRIKLSQPLEKTLVETTINHTLEAQYNCRGLLYDPRDVRIILVNI